MPTTINADTIVGGAVVTGDTSGVLELQSAGTTAVSISTGQVVTFTNTPVISGGATVVTTTGTQTLTNKTIAFGSNTFTGTLPVANGGTGLTTLTSNAVLLGNGTSSIQAVSPGASGNLLTSDGTTWTSAAPPASGGMAVLSNFVPTGGQTTVNVTNISSSVKQIILIMMGVGVGEAGTGLGISFSSNNGSSYSTNNNIYTSAGNTQFNGYLNVFGATLSGANKFSFGSGYQDAPYKQLVTTDFTGVANAVRFTFSQAFNGTGRIIVYGIS